MDDREADALVLALSLGVDPQPSRRVLRRSELDDRVDRERGWAILTTRKDESDQEKTGSPKVSRLLV